MMCFNIFFCTWKLRTKNWYRTAAPAAIRMFGFDYDSRNSVTLRLVKFRDLTYGAGREQCMFCEFAKRTWVKNLSYEIYNVLYST